MNQTYIAYSLEMTILASLYVHLFSSGLNAMPDSSCFKFYYYIVFFKDHCSHVKLSLLRKGLDTLTRHLFLLSFYVEKLLEKIISSQYFFKVLLIRQSIFKKLFKHV